VRPSDDNMSPVSVIASLTHRGVDVLAAQMPGADLRIGTISSSSGSPYNALSEGCSLGRSRRLGE
jgi:hypothetical protein